MKRLSAVMLSLALMMGITQKAYAYLDPSTGNYLLQMIVATGLAALFAIKMFFKEIKRAVHGILKKGKSEK